MTDVTAEPEVPAVHDRAAAAPTATVRVSVVMPFCDAGRFIAEAVESVLGQTYRDLELLAIDDGSTDDGAAIVAAIAQRDPRVRLIAEGKRGFVPSLNRGLELARGEYIARMDADDVCLPDRLARQVAFLDSHPDVGVVGGQILALLEGVTLTPPWWIDNPLDHEAIVRSLRSRNSIYHPTSLLRKSAVDAVGGYRPAFTVVQDYDLWMRLADRVRLANLPDRVLNYRFHEGQATERKLELAYLCTWCVRYAAAERRAGRPDPIRADTRIDREQAFAWGLDAESMEAEIAWIRASHKARGHLLRGRRLRAVGAFAKLLLSHPGPFLRRAALAARSRLSRRSEPAPTEPTPAWPASR